MLEHKPYSHISCAGLCWQHNLSASLNRHRFKNWLFILIRFLFRCLMFIFCSQRYMGFIIIILQSTIRFMTSCFFIHRSFLIVIFLPNFWNYANWKVSFKMLYRITTWNWSIEMENCWGFCLFDLGALKLPLKLDICFQLNQLYEIIYGEQVCKCFCWITIAASSLIQCMQTE